MSGQRTDSQAKVILNYLFQMGSITAVQAYELCGSMRLAARIADIKDMGYDIYTERVPILGSDGMEIGHYGRYHLRGVPYDGDKEG